MFMETHYDALKTRGRALEDAFFAKRDRELAAAIQRQMTAEESERTLANIIGMADKLAFKEIAKAEADVSVLAAMALLPLVEVAWCDGDVSPKEQEAILKGAEGIGVAQGSPVHQFLHNWIQQRPSPKALAAWNDYVRAICATLDPETTAKLKQAIIGRAEKIAQAAGGILGLGNKVSPAERACLDELAKAFA